MITGATEDLWSRYSDRYVGTEKPGYIASGCNDPQIVIEHEGGADRLFKREPEQRCRVRFCHALLCEIQRRM